MAWSRQDGGLFKTSVLNKRSIVGWDKIAALEVCNSHADLCALWFNNSSVPFYEPSESYSYDAKANSSSCLFGALLTFNICLETTVLKINTFYHKAE